MEKINFIGIAELKTEYILYICKSLKEFKHSKILLLTENIFFNGETKPYEYSTNIDVFVLDTEANVAGILNQFEYANYDYIIHDSQNSYPEIVYDKRILLSDAYAHHLKRNLMNDDQIEYMVIMNLITTSKITTRFIQKAFDRKIETVIHFYLEVNDRAIFIDNSYNNSLRIKKFGKYFKESIIAVLTIILNEETETIAKEMKKVWRKN